MRHVLESGSEGRPHGVEEIVVNLDGVGFPVVAQPDVQREPVADLPVVLNVGREPDVALGAIGVRSAVRARR